jgi:hypothetical protein
MPRRSMVMLLLGVACLFAAIGSIADAINMEHSTPLSFAFSVVVYGVDAVLWAFFFTEIQFATAIQAELVPSMSTRSGRFEFYGVSVPSGNVGGDLLDVVTNGNSFCACIAISPDTAFSPVH